LIEDFIIQDQYKDAYARTTTEIQ